MHILAGGFPVCFPGSHPGWEAEQFEEAEVVSSGEQFVVFGEGSSINEAERWPYSLTGRTQD